MWKAIVTWTDGETKTLWDWDVVNIEWQIECLRSHPDFKWAIYGREG